MKKLILICMKFIIVEIISNGGGGMKKKTGFYIILLITIGLIGTAAILAPKKDKEKLDKDELGDTEDFIILDEDSLEISKMDEGPNIDDYLANRQIRETFEDTQEGEIEEEMEPEEEPDDLDYTFVDSNTYIELEEMIKPVEGSLGLSFTNENLIYSKTLEEWTSHKGIDILAKEGTEVKAVLSGTINEVYEDRIWGIVVIIDHGNGLLSKYANLSTDTMVSEGMKLNKGDVISKVGKTASIEMMEEPHLHFEIIKDGINQNPLDYLPVFSQGK